MPALHIAVLDDEVDITQLLADHLRNQGFRATQVHSGQALMALMPVKRHFVLLSTVA